MFRRKHPFSVRSQKTVLLDLIADIRNVADDLEALARCEAESSIPGQTEIPVTQGKCSECPDPTPSHTVSPAVAPTVPSTAASAAPLPDTPPAPSAPAAQLQPNERINPYTGEIVRLDLPILRMLAAEKAKTKEQKTQMKALLQKHGVSKLTELPITDYFVFQKEVEAIE